LGGNLGAAGIDTFGIRRSSTGGGTFSNLFTIINNGNVGIGTTNPGAKLEVAGQIKITGGSPGAGKVLTSDASGLATWAAASVGTLSCVNRSSATAYGSCDNLCAAYSEKCVSAIQAGSAYSCTSTQYKETLCRCCKII